MMFDLNELIRPNIRDLVAYASARAEFRGHATVFLDANENSFGSPAGDAASGYNRYPDPMQWKLKEKISRIKGVPPQNIFAGNGSDEAIDLLFRAFCRPCVDNVLLLPPTYGMYEVAAKINDVETRTVQLLPDFQLNMEGIADAIDENTKLIFICSPNNPTGNAIAADDIEVLLHNFSGIVVVDEAYINYSRQKTTINMLTEFPNLVVLQTLSKAWGMAALRIGLAFASEEIIAVFNKIKPPYNVNAASLQLALEALEQVTRVNDWIKQTVSERGKLAEQLARFTFVEKVYPSDANFLLVKVADARKLYTFLTGKGIVVRDRSAMPGCEGCLRITVGKPEENNALVEAFETFTL
jgi:histidinol-phosphate aminotransferase